MKQAIPCVSNRGWVNPSRPDVLPQAPSDAGQTILSRLLQTSAPIRELWFTGPWQPVWDLGEVIGNTNRDSKRSYSVTAYYLSCRVWDDNTARNFKTPAPNQHLDSLLYLIGLICSKNCVKLAGCGFTGRLWAGLAPVSPNDFLKTNRCFLLYPLYSNRAAVVWAFSWCWAKLTF